MVALNLLLVIRDFHLLCELEEGYPYMVVEVDRLSIGRHRLCILHLQEDRFVTNVLIEKDVLSKPDELLVCVGVIVSVLIYTGLNSDGRLLCRILSCREDNEK